MSLANFPETSPICMKCKGSCLNINNPVATQKAVLEKFGMIANKCVPDCNGRVVCPHGK